METGAGSFRDFVLVEILAELIDVLPGTRIRVGEGRGDRVAVLVDPRQRGCEGVQ